MTTFFGITNPAIPQLFTQFGDGDGSGYVSALVSLVVSAIIAFGGLYFVIQLLLGGFDWIRSGGDKASLESARGKVSNALIGIILLFSVYAIIGLISTIFNINILEFTIPTIL